MTAQATIWIPRELLEQAAHRNLLLFVGERLTVDARHQPVPDRLIDELAVRYGGADTDRLLFPELAQAYEDDQGRFALITFLRDQLEQLGDDPQPVHRLIASLTQCNV